MEKKFENGEHIRDKVSGLEGIILGIAEYYNGCIRYQIQPKIKKDGTFLDAEWIDEEQLESTKQKGLINSKEKHGGDRPNPKSNML